ncbi:MAG: hypothetical protein BGO81_10790 [Devosia sp. 66-22]|nr:MAG: hypothetical protein BGO81_10790 [Devosia sp. 66-22]
MIFSDKQSGDVENTSHETEDQSGRRVTVKISREAIEDYGLDACRDKASDKFDAGDIETGGWVQVRTTDF